MNSINDSLIITIAITFLKYLLLSIFLALYSRTAQSKSVSPGTATRCGENCSFQLLRRGSSNRECRLEKRHQIYCLQFPCPISDSYFTPITSAKKTGLRNVSVFRPQGLSVVSGGCEAHHWR